MSASFPELNKSVLVRADAIAVWNALTKPQHMAAWMGEPEQHIEVETSWQAGSTFLLRAFHHAPLTNFGFVLKYDPPHSVAYTYQSSISMLPDRTESKTVVHFELEITDTGTLLHLRLHNFPTEAIYRHVDFYWNATLRYLKEFVEAKGHALV